MKVYNVVICWEEEMGLVHVYSYSTLKKAVTDAVGMLRSVVSGLWDGSKEVSFSELAEILTKERYYVNKHSSNHTEDFWIRIDSSKVDG